MTIFNSKHESSVTQKFCRIWYNMTIQICNIKYTINKSSLYQLSLQSLGRIENKASVSLSFKQANILFLAIKYAYLFLLSSITHKTQWLFVLIATFSHHFLVVAYHLLTMLNIEINSSNYRQLGWPLLASTCLPPGFHTFYSNAGKCIFSTIILTFFSSG